MTHLMREELGMSNQIVVVAFAVFLYDLLRYDSIPWDERASRLRICYRVIGTPGTYKRWMGQLFARGILWRDKGDITYWKTYYDTDGVKHQEEICENGEAAYKEAVTRLLDLREESEAEIAEKKAAGENTEKMNAWGMAYKKLWNEKKCYIFRCGKLIYNGLKVELPVLLDLSEQVCEEHLATGRYVTALRNSQT